MLNTVGLSLDQAPPISVPFRFFLTAPLFAMAAGIELLLFGDGILITRWAPLTIGVTHLLTLGFLAMVMCGAMLQMLPVMAGSPVPRVVLVGTLTHLLLTLGTILLQVALVSGHSMVMMIAVIVLGLCFALFTGAVGIALWRVHVPGSSVKGMRLAVTALAATVTLGIAVAVGFSGIGKMDHLALLTDIHLGWGVLGWVGLLLLSVSFQLVPMFQVTPEYPQWQRHYLPQAIFAGLLVWLLLRLGSHTVAWFESAALLVLGLVVAGYLLYSIDTLRLQQLRKRKIPDITLFFWRLGMLMLLFSALLWVSGLVFPPFGDSQQFSFLLGIGLIQGVALSVINGMLYKIVPFLCWFHLQSRQMALMCIKVRVPHMKELLADRSTKRQFYLHLAALMFALVAVISPAWFLRPAALLFVLSNLWLLLNLATAVHRYRNTFKQLTPSTSGG